MVSFAAPAGSTEDVHAARCTGPATSVTTFKVQRLNPRHPVQDEKTGPNSSRQTMKAMIL